MKSVMMSMVAFGTLASAAGAQPVPLTDEQLEQIMAAGTDHVEQQTHLSMSSRVEVRSDNGDVAVDVTVDQTGDGTKTVTIEREGPGHIRVVTHQSSQVTIE
jgi:hypothetical protein